MPKPRNTDGAIEDLGVLLTAAYGLDTEWMERGTCYGWGSNRPGTTTPWQATSGKRYGEFSGGELVKYALIVCSGCPAQYDCTSYAIKGMMVAGTWGVSISQLRWLQGQDDGLDLVEIARELDAPVQSVVADVFAARTSKA